MNDKRFVTSPGEMSRLDWEGHISKWEQSNLSQAEYCRQNGVRYSAFLYWRKRLKGISNVKSASPLKFVRFGEPSSLERSFLRDTSLPPTSQWYLRIQVKDLNVEVSNQFSPITLAKVIQTLRGL